jgi:hypothetical protein
MNTEKTWSADVGIDIGGNGMKAARVHLFDRRGSKCEAFPALLDRTAAGRVMPAGAATPICIKTSPTTCGRPRRGRIGVGARTQPGANSVESIREYGRLPEKKYARRLPARLGLAWRVLWPELIIMADQVLHGIGLGTLIVPA